MVDIKQDLGVQSYCFRHFSENAKVIELVKQCGLNKVELCGVHADFTKPETFNEVVALYQSKGVDIVSIGVQGLNNDEATEEKFFEFVKGAGAKFMSVSFGVDSVPAGFRTSEKLADRYDVCLAIHNHGGRHWLGSSEMLRNVFKNTSERIGLCLDTAWALDSGEDPVRMAETFADRLYGIHIKDFVFDQARRPEDVVVGTGNLDLPGLADILKKVSFSGFVVLEYEGDVENPVPAVAKCVEAVRSL